MRRTETNSKSTIFLKTVTAERTKQPYLGEKQLSTERSRLPSSRPGHAHPPGLLPYFLKQAKAKEIKVTQQAEKDGADT